MDEDLGYSNEDVEERTNSSSEWQFQHLSEGNLERDSSKFFLQHQNYHLHLIKKRTPIPERPIIPSSKQERLSYYRNYVASPNKLQIACMHNMVFNRYFWEYICNALNKSLTHTYVYMFLGSYVPREHMFVSKMVPFMCGTKIAFIITGLLEVMVYVANTVWLFDYVIASIFLQNPWNRCPNDGFFYGPVRVNCYNLLDFGNRVVNETVTFVDGLYFIEEDNELLQLVQIEYFRYRVKNMGSVLKAVYICFIWTLISACNKQIFKKNFWKVLNTVHWCIISIDILSFLYLIIYYFQENHDVPYIQFNLNAYNVAFSNAGVDFLAESTTSPPVVHVLTARSTQEILPGRDSAVFVLSNAICYIFRAMLSYRVKRHCESLAKVPIFLPGIDMTAWLYFWPMYFSTFFLGDMYTLMFLSLHFAMEVMTTTVTFECLVEIMAGEWPKLRRWMITSCLTAVAVAINVFCMLDLSVLLNFNKSTATLLECLVLYGMYPVCRLMDDVTFHYGTSPSLFRFAAVCWVPVYYAFKYYFFVVPTVPVILASKDGAYITSLCLGFALVLVPVFLGMVFCSWIYVWKDKKDWRRMFAPVPDWGPRDYETRQLRKQFDSRTYYTSQESRNLSRYIISKVESKAYRLGIKYDPSRRSTAVPSAFNSENEKTF